MIEVLTAQSIPVPGELELAIPGDVGFFKVLFVVSFILHIVFVNLTVAGGILAVFNEWRGMRTGKEQYDRLARELSVQTSTHKSLAVVLGVAPLLIISVIYTRFFYVSTILVGKAWLMLIAIITIAFLLLYVYKFTWDRWMEKKGLHLFFGIGGTLLLLYVPLVFLTNISAMLQPELWVEGQSIFAASFHYPTVWQRYLHFLFATLAIMGLYLVLLGNRRSRRADHNAEDSRMLIDFGKRVAFLFTTLQVVAGPILFFSLKGQVRQGFLGGSALQTVLLSVALLLAIGLIVTLYLYKKKESVSLLRGALALLILVAGAMGWLRHEVRDAYLKPYQAAETIEPAAEKI